jgi:hypothetical protein
MTSSSTTKQHGAVSSIDGAEYGKDNGGFEGQITQSDPNPSVPNELKALKQWVVWKYQPRRGEQTKVPYSPNTGGPASSRDPDTWGTYEEALAVRGGYEGLGCVIAKPFVAIDLDKCLNPQTGQVELWAQEVIDQVDSYTELSPSGCGFHIWVKGELPPGRRRAGRVEMYDKDRYFTVTGKHVPGTPTNIQERDLSQLHSQLESLDSGHKKPPQSVKSTREQIFKVEGQACHTDCVSEAIQHVKSPGTVASKTCQQDERVAYAMSNSPKVTNRQHDPSVNAYEAAGNSPPAKPEHLHLKQKQIQQLKLDAGIGPYRQRLTLKAAGSKFTAHCPWHRDRNPSLSVFQGDDGDYRFHCFACAERGGEASGDVIAFVQKKDKLSFREAIGKIADDCQIRIDRIEQQQKPIKFDYDQQKGAARLHEVKEYLKNRGIDLRTAARYRLGVADFPGMGIAIAMPFSDSVVKFRAVNPASKADKFRHLPGSSSANLLFGLDDFDSITVLDCGPNLYVAESELDALTLVSHGFNAVSVSSATTCLDSQGNLKIDKAAIDRICELAERIYIATDMDGPGQGCAEAFLRALPQQKIRRLMWLYRGKNSKDPKDIGELYQRNPEDFSERIKTLTTKAEERARRIITVYSDLPKASDLGKNRRPVDWLVQNIIPLNDKSILTGYWGNYKSYVALSLAKAVATGAKFLGLYETQKRPRMSQL